MKPHFLKGALTSRFRIGVRYCGGCNPQIDRSRIVKELGDGLQRMGREVDLTTERDKCVEVVLLVNGCRHACLEAENLKGVHGPRVISVRGEMVDDECMEEGDMAKVLIQRIDSFL